ncbi:cytochrome c biogenesis protein CcsA [Luteolibacter yonseiensis]|uniref:Cytochrome c biogenesis protein CcsA n=1 Tax=Luteolibacter yonseiensis TaxID=1144680 RepID=A0A934VDM7_9BACT|nr:cytochrome c biogenesis protein CcsA [Luteolibacter yonseiensis]MBK1817719.1 cytochrome c biogenesis protein CcsA [Luteolibacter yonseiensis]
MSNPPSKIGRWIAAGLALLLLSAVFYNVVKDNMPQAEARKIEGYTSWDPQTIEVAESIPLQDGGRIKPLSTYAGFSMLSLHGARSMVVQDEKGKKHSITPTAWMMDTLFRPQFAVKLPTFRIDNSSILEAVGLKTGDKRDRYSYDDIEPGREKLIELAKKYEMIADDKRDSVHKQTIALAYQIRNYESLLGYFGFARYGLVLKGSGKDGAPDQHANISTVMAGLPQIRQEISQSQAHGHQMEPRLQSLLQQVIDAANFAKYGLFILPPADPKEAIWLSAGNTIMSAIADPKADPQQAIADIQLLEGTVRSLAVDEASFRKELTTFRDTLEKRATARGEHEHVKLEAEYYRMNWFLYAMIYFILGTVVSLAMWTVGNGKAGKVLYWGTLAATVTGLVYCIIPIVKRCIIMQRPPVGNLYDTIIFIAATTVFIALLIEWLTRRRFALGIAPILGTLLIILARRYEVGDAKDNMDPLVAVLDSNYWLTIHVLTITLGYAAGLLSAFLSFCYLLMRGLDLDNGDRDIRRSFTRAVYGMICLTLFLSLVGTVLGGIWANDSWGRFWGWDPKENGALMIVLWTLAILHARLGGYIRDWGLHFASVFTGAVVAFSWWHVNFLNTGLHTYGFTADKKVMIFVFYGIIAAILVFGAIARALEAQNKVKQR